jgi:serine/threonine protein kinase
MTPDVPLPTAELPPSHHLWLADLGWHTRFRVFERLGAGGMGQVWRAEEVTDDSPPRIVAIKVLDPTRIGDEHLLARLDTEAAALMKLREAGRHEGIVPILDFTITENTAGIVMEYIPGQNLRSWCDTHQLDLRRRVELLTKAAHAAGWCHHHSIIHRDLKPANILVHSATGEPIVVDFSIAKLDHLLPLTLTGEALGTVPYMAPEQIDRTQGDLTPATDVYALGATLYELLTKVHPHPGTLADVIQRHQNETPPARPSALNPHISRDLECIILKALSHRPTDRYPDGHHLAADLDLFLAGEPVLARPVSTLVAITRRARRRPALTAALFAVVCLTTLATWTWQRQRQETNLRQWEAKLTTALQVSVWSSERIAAAEAVIDEIRLLSPTEAISSTERFQARVIKDIQTALESTTLSRDDLGWVTGAIAWVTEHSEEPGTQLKTAHEQRMGTWQVLAHREAPFVPEVSLFTGARLVQRDGYTFPDYSPTKGEIAEVRILEDVTSPSELSCTLSASPSLFRSVFLQYKTDGLEIEAHLALPSKMRSKALNLADVTGNPKDTLILMLRVGDEVVAARAIPLSSTLAQPFTLRLQVTTRQVEVAVEGLPPLSYTSDFALSSSELGTWWIGWPRDIGMQQFTLRTRASTGLSPLESGDLLVTQRQWQPALSAYSRVISTPNNADELAYKKALCVSTS